MVDMRLWASYGLVSRWIGKVVRHSKTFALALVGLFLALVVGLLVLTRVIDQSWPIIEALGTFSGPSCQSGGV